MKTKSIITLLFAIVLLTLASCSKDYWWSYHYKLERSHFLQEDWQKIDLTSSGLVTKKQAKNLAALDAATLERKNTGTEWKYRIDTSWVEPERCLGCKEDWEK